MDDRSSPAQGQMVSSIRRVRDHNSPRGAFRSNVDGSSAVALIRLSEHSTPMLRLTGVLLLGFLIVQELFGRPRARDLGVPFDGTPGPLNAITDVAGVEVGHVTLNFGTGKLEVGRGPVRTGVT